MANLKEGQQGDVTVKVVVEYDGKEVITIGEYERRLIRIPRISFKFRLPYDTEKLP